MGVNLKTYIEDYSREKIDKSDAYLYQFYLRDGYLNMFLNFNLEAVMPSTKSEVHDVTCIGVDRLCNYTKIGSYDDYMNHIFDFITTLDDQDQTNLTMPNFLDIRHLETNSVVVYIIQYNTMPNDGEMLINEKTFTISEYFVYDVKLDIKLTEMLEDYCAICQDLNRIHMISAALLRWNLLKSFQNLNDVSNCIEIYNDLTRIVNQDDDCTKCCRINNCNKNCTDSCNICIDGSCSIN